jgi:hypothetical protein
MMIAPSEIFTSNGRLRRLVKSDSAAFSELNADPLVMEFFPHSCSLKESQEVGQLRLALRPGSKDDLPAGSHTHVFTFPHRGSKPCPQRARNSLGR